MRRLLLVAALGAAACNPYDPKLGDKPFLCGTDPPRCPDGYTAVDLSFTRCECQLNATAGDAAVYICDGDKNEPNETFHASTVTSIDGQQVCQYTSSQTSVCPSDDVDVYKLQVAARGTLITADVTTQDLDRQQPVLELLGDDGASIGADHATPAPGHIVATKTVEQGSYYVQVSGGGAAINYTVAISIVPPAGMAPCPR